MFTIMVRGLFNQIEFSYVQFPCTMTTSVRLCFVSKTQRKNIVKIYISYVSYTIDVVRRFTSITFLQAAFIELLGESKANSLGKQNDHYNVTKFM